MTRLQRAKAPFVQRPLGSLLVAALLAAMALLFEFAVFPPAQKYGPWHNSVMAVLSGAVAAFFGWCAREGFQQRARDPQRRW